MGTDVVEGALADLKSTTAHTRTLRCAISLHHALGLGSSASRRRHSRCVELLNGIRERFLDTRVVSPTEGGAGAIPQLMTKVFGSMS